MKKIIVLIMILISAGWIVKVNSQNGWQQKKPMEIAKGGSQSCVIDNMIYVFGGMNSSYATLNSAEVYNTETDEWSQLANMPLDLCQSNAEAINDTIYIVGGWRNDNGNWSTTNSASEYDPQGNTWKKIKDCPVNTGTNSSCVLNDTLYILGGLGSANDASNQKQALVYYPRSDTWDSIPDMLYERGERFSACVYNSQIYVFGGLHAISSNELDIIGKAEKYDPVSNMWTELADMHVPVVNHISLEYEDKLYVFGGDTGTFTINKSYSSNIVQEYDPSTNKWGLMQGMPFRRSDMTGQKVGDSLFLFGGYQDDSRDFANPLSEVWRFNLDSLKVLDVTGITKTEADYFSVYPNPTKGLLHLEELGVGFHTIEITSLNGQLLHTDRMEGPTHQINLSSLQKGLYFITVRSKDYVRTEKIIKL